MTLSNHRLEQLEKAFSELKQEFAKRNPLSLKASQEAARALPGGNTRSVLFYEPFPLTMVSGQGAEVRDLDGHTYIDFVGEFSAGLYGHSDPIIKQAIIEALECGIVLAAPNVLEARLAEAVQARFPSMERLRFCNSGTEANILALVTARQVTGRSKILVFDGAYHGGVLVFSKGGNPINIPFDYVIAPYNDYEATRSLIQAHKDDLACVIVEPILGAAGNIPAERSFLEMLREETAKVGALLIFDEVKTSRCGAGGIQGQIGLTPDLTTLGKYLGGGLSSGAFGGRADIMDRFDPHRPDAFRHAGTFNNNVCSMAAGLAGLTRVFTPERADAFLVECEAFRVRLNDEMVARKVPLRFTGQGSLFTMHLSPNGIRTAADVTPTSRRVGQFFHMYALLNGVAIASRGDFYQSLPMTDAHRQTLRNVLVSFVDEYAELLKALVDQEIRAAA